MTVRLWRIRPTTVPILLIQMRKTILLHLLKFGLQRTAGPYSWVINGNRYLAAGGVLCPREQTSSVRSVTAHAVFFPKPTRDLPAASYSAFLRLPGGSDRIRPVAARRLNQRRTADAG